jgi:UDP-galactopyranose mutase
LFTLYQLYGITTPEEAELKFNQIRIPIDNPSNLEEYCLATVGPDIYQIFIEGYTTKQWNCHPRDLSTSIVKRIPIRLTFDDNYYDSLYQGVPIEGYTVIIEKMMDGIQVDLNIDFLDDRDYLLNKYDHVIYTGTIDAFFNYCYGVLGYRSLRFEKELIKTSDFQGNAIINYTDATVPWTRIIEHKHFDRKSDSKQTIITREYPTDWKPGGIEFYPVNNKQNYDLLRKYENEAEKLTEKVHFGGRLGKYRYYDMDQVIASALKFCDSFK